jgi:transcriptional regulator with XRE-family HTH domain
MTQEELAEKAEIHVNFVGGIERASRNPSLTSIVKLAKALKVSPKDLVP